MLDVDVVHKTHNVGFELYFIRKLFTLSSFPEHLDSSLSWFKITKYQLWRLFFVERPG